MGRTPGADVTSMTPVPWQRVAAEGAVAAVAAVAAGTLLFPKALVYVMLSAALLGALLPHAWVVAGLLPLLVVGLQVVDEGISAGLVLTCALPCLTSAVVGRSIRQRRSPPPAEAATDSLWPASSAGPRRFGCLLALLTAFPIYPMAKLAWANIQTDRFCKTVKVGDPIIGLEGRAKEYGLTVWSFPRKEGKDGTVRSAEILAWEAWAFGRYFCESEHDDKHVTKVHRYFLD